MSDFRTRLAAATEGARTDESGPDGAEQSQPDRDISPFSMGYDVDSYALDAETTDRMLTVLVAATNLL